MIGCSVRRLGASALLLAGLAAATAGAEPDAIARGDAAYARRGDGQQGGHAAPEPIGEAVAAYEEAVRVLPSRLEAHWKLVRALFFQGEYAVSDPTQKHAIFGHGVEAGRVAEAWLASSSGQTTLHGDPQVVAAILGGNPDATPICFWSAVVLASWGRGAGPMLALREGIAERLRHRAELVIALDPAFEAGGAHRLLGRIHAEVPRIPFVTPWVQRERALSELRRAFALAPDDPWNQLLLGMTLLELAPAERPRAIELLQGLATSSPRPDFIVEDIGVEQKARELLDRSEGG